MSSHARAKNDPEYGKGAVSLDFSEQAFIDPDEVKRRLREVFRSPDFSPPRLPASATQLLTLTRKREVPVKEVTELLEQDQLLAAEVLRIAQSAAYSGQGTPVRTLGEALVRLGLQRTADIFLQASLQMRVFRVKAYQRSMDELRRHSVAVAHIARHVSRQTSLYDEHAFLCGLLHDVGIATALIAISESTPRGKSPPDFSQVWHPIRDAHEEAAGMLGRCWGLPEEIVFVIEHHHHFMVGGYAHPTSAVIEVSNFLAESVGFGFGQETLPDSLTKALTGIGLSEAELPRLAEQATRLVEGLS